VSVLSTAALARAFGANKVLTQVDLSVQRSTVYGLVGLNGAGKTTLIRILLGLLRPSAGSVRVLDTDPWRHDPSVYRRMGVVMEHDGFWGNLTFVQNMRIFAAAKRIDADALERYLAEWWSDCGLTGSPRKARDFSRGQRMQSALCRAFLGWPEVVLLDEPTVGLDIEAYEHFGRLVREAKSRGSAVLVSSHQLDAIESLCDSVGLLEAGTLRTLSGEVLAGETWLVMARGGEGDVGELLRTVGVEGAEPAGGGWQFRTGTASEQVPRVVETLVRHGWRVQRVQPAHDSLRHQLRRHAAVSPSKESAG
jgi:ABC-type multidrug transport system ATPase subunit